MGSQESSLEETLPEGQGTVGLCDLCAKADPARVGLGPKRSRSCLNIWCLWSLSKVREGAGGRARNGLWLPALCAQPSSSALSTRLLHVTPRVLVQFSRSLLCALDLSPPELRADSWCISVVFSPSIQFSSLLPGHKGKQQLKDALGVNMGCSLVTEQERPWGLLGGSREEGEMSVGSFVCPCCLFFFW